MTQQRGPVGYAARSDVGRVRLGNEDRYLARPPVFAVADGMGGHEAGEVASAMAVEAIEHAISAQAIGDADALVAALVEANAEIRTRGSREPELDGMGTTCTAALIDRDVVWLAHVGDSRAYLLRAGQLTQLTDDHSLVANLVRDGMMALEDARVDGRRNIITRALGAEDRLRVDVSSFEIEPGDRLLLCSDGLTGLVEDARLAEVLGSGAGPDEVADRLIELANEAGGDDNITVIVIDPEAVAETPAESPPAALRETASGEKPRVERMERTERMARIELPAAAGPSRRRRSGVLLLIAAAALLAIAAMMFGPLATPTAPGPLPASVAPTTQASGAPSHSGTLPPIVEPASPPP